MEPLPRAVLALLLVASCAAPPARPGLPAVLSASPPAASAPPSAAPTVSVSASAVAAPPEEPSDDESQDNTVGMLDADGPAAPCDFARGYRGKVGEDAVSLVLSRSGANLQGFSAYDAGFGDIALLGSVRPDGTLALAERKDGKDLAVLTGACAPASGVITGSWRQGAVTPPFTWRPREAGGVGLVQRGRRSERAGRGSSCAWNVRSPAVFGLGDAERAARINGALRVRFPGMNEEELEQRVSRCAPGGDNQVLGWYSVEANTSGLLSVVENGYVYLGPAAHGDFGAAVAAISVDVPSGRRLALGDVVTSSKALRPLITSCMPLLAAKLGEGDAWWWEREIQGVPADKNGEPVDETSPAFVASSLREPRMLVLPDGVAVLIGSQPTVGATYALRGPVLRWAALLRAGALNERSPVARLWAGARRAADGEPVCQRIFEPRWVKKPKP